MKCKGCQQKISEDACQKVADWSFCQDCFEKLIQKSQNGGSQVSADAPELKPDPKAGLEAKKAVCRICAKPIEKDQIKKIGSWIFCSACHADLIFRPPETVLPANQSAEKNGDAQKEKPEIDAESAGRVKVQMNKTVVCQDCGRQIVELGSKTVEGKPYCPDCFYARQGETAENVEIHIQEKSTPQPVSTGITAGAVSDGGSQCDACERDTVEESLKAVDGFLLCEACLTTDKELAVQIARRRHRERLNMMKKKLD